MNVFRLALAVFCSIVCIISSAQNRSNRGKEFWLGYGHNILFNYPQPLYGVNSQTQAIYISTEEPAQVTVSIPGTTWIQKLTIPANTVDASIILPKNGVFDTRITREGRFDKSIHIESDVPVVVYAHQYAFWSSTATMLMPVETYGYKYFSVNYKQQVGVDSCYSWFYVIASEDNTRIEITPSDSTQGPPGTVWQGWLPGKKYTIDLKKGEIYNVFGMISKAAPVNNYKFGKDLTGSKIVSVSGADGKCHPIAVFSGSSRLTFCDGDGGEVMQQQIFPASAWGTRYLTFHSRANPGIGIATPYLNFYRISVQDPTTIVKKNGVILNGLINNFYYEYSSDGGDYIEADKPVLVTQYTPSEWQCNPPNPMPTVGGPTGDPEMYILSPIEQGINRARFFKTKNFNATAKFVNVIVPTNGMTSMKLDGSPIAASNTMVHPNNPDYTVISVRLYGADSQHYLECDSAFNALTFGVGEWESYGYNAGTYINNLNAFTDIRNAVLSNPPKDSVTCVKTPFRAFVSTAYNLNSIKWRFSEVKGLNLSSDTLIVNPTPISSYRYYGRTYYTYSLNVDLLAMQQGKFQLPVTYTSAEIDECSQTESTDIFFTATAGLTADFTSTTACMGDTVVFTPKINPGPSLTYRWDFDDNSFFTSQLAKKAFLSGTTQSIRLRIYSANGCAGDTTKTINLFSGPLLNASINGKYCVDSTIHFRSNFTDTSGSSTLYWDFGDGQKYNANRSSIANHNYRQQATSLLAKHWVVDAKGCKSDTISIAISSIKPSPPIPLINLQYDSLCSNALIKIETNITNASTWNWDLGDGTTSTKPSPISKKYSAPGNYLVKLNYIDANGCGSPTAIQTIRIYPNPIISAGADHYIKKGNSVPLQIASNPPTVDAIWTPPTYLDDPTIINPVSTPDKNITYFITAIEKTSKCSSTDTINIILLDQLGIPNTFTPNGDGINDFWEIYSLAAYPKCLVEIYNSAGQVVYQSRGYSSPWNGKSKGKDLPVGTYYYVIDPGNGDPKKAGYVTIFR